MLRAVAVAPSCVLAFALALSAQEPPDPGRTEPPAGGAAADAKAKAAAAARPKPIRFTTFPVAEAEALDVDVATKAAIEGLLRLQEGDEKDQWPYEGVYREDRGQLPVGYRVGGTSIVCLAMLAAPGYATDEKRQQAVARGLAFVLRTLDHERMSIGFKGSYDVRGWGHVYALQLLLELADHGLVPPELRDDAAAKTAFCVQALCALAIPENGGWNYSMPAGFGKAGNRASTFMTAPALQALFHAKTRGHEVPDEILDQALAALERARSEPGGYAYGATATSQNDLPAEKLPMMDRVQSSAARATAVETTLLLAGRGDPARHRQAVLRFFEHWDDLAVRKSQTGTHVQPYGIAPYYFLFGHVYAAQAIELLQDEAEQRELRTRMLQHLARSRDDDGTWNDRHFDRSAGYGTAFALLTMHMPSVHRPFPRPRVAGGAGK